MNNRIDRRKFVIEGLIAGLSFCNVACKDKKESNSVGFFTCDDFSMLTEADRARRKGLGYVEKSPLEESTCRNCKLWLAPQEGFACGGCTLFKGPVQDDGYCTYWAVP